MELSSNTSNESLIAIEGLDGSGKTTLLAKMRESLIKMGYKVICSKEPGNNVAVIVLSDRYYLSGLAYHYVDGISFEDYAYLNRKVVKPNIYIFLNVDLTTALKRIKKPRDRWESIIDKVYYAYLDAIKFLEQKERAIIYTINANKSISSVFHSALEILKQERVIS